jgi:LiaI-LiaF-like transmembrane region
MMDDSAALIRAIRGPVIMITVGVLFSLDEFNVASFSKTWPAILIVVGILNLSRWTGRRPL